MPLEQEQKNLFQEIATAIANNQDITLILKGASSDDLLAVFKASREKKKEEKVECFIFLYEMLKDENYRSAVLNVAKEKDILKQFLDINLVSVKEGFQPVDHETEIESTSKEYKLVDFITHPLGSGLNILDDIKKIFGLEDFWKVISTDDRDNIKDALEREKDKCDNEGEKYKYQAALEKVTQAEKSMADEKSSETDVEAKNKQKAIVVGSIFYVIAAVGVISTYFPIGTLPPLAIIGIAFAAGLVAGLVAGGITYAISKPSNELEKVDAQSKICPGADVTA